MVTESTFDNYLIRTTEERSVIINTDTGAVIWTGEGARELRAMDRRGEPRQFQDPETVLAYHRGLLRWSGQ